MPVLSCVTAHSKMVFLNCPQGLTKCRTNYYATCHLPACHKWRYAAFAISITALEPVVGRPLLCLPAEPHQHVAVRYKTHCNPLIARVKSTIFRSFLGLAASARPRSIPHPVSGVSLIKPSPAGSQQTTKQEKSCPSPMLSFVTYHRGVDDHLDRFPAPRLHALVDRLTEIVTANFLFLESRRCH